MNRQNISSRLALGLVLFGSVLSSACTNDLVAHRIPGVYRIDIEQGNQITAKMVDRLQTGMTERQVRYALGSPLMIDTFHPERWDYLYQMKRGNGDFEQRHITVYFSEGKLAQIEGEIPSDPADAEADHAETVVDVPVHGLIKKPFFERVWDWITL
jgi:outer membrane protein assembly factor BamE